MGDIVREFATKEKLEHTRKNLQHVQNIYRGKYGSHFFAEEAVKRILKGKGKKFVIDGMRMPDDVEHFKNKFGDKIKIVLVDADPKIKEKTALQAKNKFMEKFLIHIPLRLGLEKTDLEYSARFKNSRVEFFFTILNDKKVEFRDRTVYFNKGDQIIVAIAYKHDMESLKTYFNMYFSEAGFILSKDKSQAFILCKK